MLSTFQLGGCSEGSDEPEPIPIPIEQLLPGELGFFNPQDSTLNTKIRVEVADDDQERNMGLMNRSDLGEDEGLLFIFDTVQVQIATFQNTLIPLDLMFVRADSSITKIRENIPPNAPQLISSDEPILYAIEVNAGFVDTHQIQVGDRISFILP